MNKTQKGSELRLSIESEKYLRAETADERRMLEISFHGASESDRSRSRDKKPLSMGELPLVQVADCVSRLPRKVVDSGGFMLGLMKGEALWIELRSAGRFAIKIHIGETNAISGKAAAEMIEIGDGGSLAQDYVVTPDQMFLDEFCSAPGKVHQFARFPEHRTRRGAPTMGMMQFDIWSLKPPGCSDDWVTLVIETYSSKGFTVRAGLNGTVKQLKAVIFEEFGLPIDSQNLKSELGTTMKDLHTLAYYHVKKNDHLFLWLNRIHSNAYRLKPVQVAAGAIGETEHNIYQDTLTPGRWDREHVTSLNIHIYDMDAWRTLTGRWPPPFPREAAYESSRSLGFYDLLGEPLLISEESEEVHPIEQSEDEQTNDSRKAKVDKELTNNDKRTSLQSNIPFRSRPPPPVPQPAPSSPPPKQKATAESKELSIRTRPIPPKRSAPDEPAMSEDRSKRTRLSKTPKPSSTSKGGDIVDGNQSPEQSDRSNVRKLALRTRDIQYSK